MLNEIYGEPLIWLSPCCRPKGPCCVPSNRREFWNGQFSKPTRSFTATSRKGPSSAESTPLGASARLEGSFEMAYHISLRARLSSALYSFCRAHWCNLPCTFSWSAPSLTNCSSKPAWSSNKICWHCCHLKKEGERSKTHSEVLLKDVRKTQAIASKQKSKKPNQTKPGSVWAVSAAMSKGCWETAALARARECLLYRNPTSPVGL